MRLSTKAVSNTERNCFKGTVCYGRLEIDKRYVQTSFWKVILHWLVAEIKRTFDPVQVELNVGDGEFSYRRAESTDVLFDCDVISISNFSRTHGDSSCFAFVTKKTECTCICHAFKASADSSVSKLYTLFVNGYFTADVRSAKTFDMILVTVYTLPS